MAKKVKKAKAKKAKKSNSPAKKRLADARATMLRVWGGDAHHDKLAALETLIDAKLGRRSK